MTALRAQWEELQKSLGRSQDPAVDSGLSSPVPAALDDVMASFRAAAKANGGIADVRAARLAAAAVVSGKPIGGFAAAYVEARTASALEDPERAARLASGAAVSGIPMRRVLNSNRAIMNSPYSIIPERAVRLTAAAAALGVPVSEVAQTYVRVRAEVESTAQDAALRLTLASVALSIPVDDLVSLYRPTRSGLGAYGGSETAARLVVGAAVAAKIRGTSAAALLTEQVVPAYRRVLAARPDGIEFRRAARLAVAAAISGRGIDAVVADYRTARDFPSPGIDQDRATVLVLASALSTVPIADLMELYEQTRGFQKGKAQPDAAARLVSVAALSSRRRTVLYEPLNLLTDD